MGAVRRFAYAFLVVGAVMGVSTHGTAHASTPSSLLLARTPPAFTPPMPSLPPEFLSPPPLPGLIGESDSGSGFWPGGLFFIPALILPLALLAIVIFVLVMFVRLVRAVEGLRSDVARIANGSPNGAPGSESPPDPPQSV